MAHKRIFRTTDEIGVDSHRLGQTSRGEAPERELRIRRIGCHFSAVIGGEGGGPIRRYCQYDGFISLARLSRELQETQAILSHLRVQDKH